MAASDCTRSFQASCEYMIRWTFSPHFKALNPMQAAAQHDMLRRLFEEMGQGEIDPQALDEAKHEAFEAIKRENKVSSIWMSKNFVMPLFASLAYNYATTLIPAQIGRPVFVPTISRHEGSFFGFRLDAVNFEEEAYDNHKNRLLVCLYGAAATKSLLINADRDVLKTAMDYCTILAPPHQD